MAIRWIMNAWQMLPRETIVKCFHKCGFQSSSTVPSDSNDEMDNEFLYKELTGSSSSTDIEEFIDFDRNVETCESAVDISSVAWKEELREQCVQSVIGEPSVQAQSSDDDDDDDVELVSVRELPVPSAVQVLKMLDSIQQFVASQSESMELNASIEELIHSVEKLKLKNQKQGDIRSYIM